MRRFSSMMTYVISKLSKIIYWSVRDAFKVLWVTLTFIYVRAWRMPERTHRKVRLGDRLRVCIISEYYYPTLGGITENVYNFAKRLLMKGHEVTLITSNAGDHQGRGEIEGLRIIRIGRSKEIYSNGSIARMTFRWLIHKKIEEIFAENEFDVVHIHSPITPMLPLLAQKYIRCPVVGTYHTDFEKSAALAFCRPGAQIMLDHMDAIAAVSPVSIKSMGKYLDDRGKARLIPNGVDTEWFYRRKKRLKNLDDGRPNILYIGRFDPRNGFSKMVKAFEIVKKNITNARLVVVGYGPLQSYYMSKIPKYLEKDILLVGKTDLTRPQYYSSSDVICVPAQKAACSVAILEAMATETPIVASGIDGFSWIIEHGKEALLVPDLEPESYAKAIIRVLEDDELREKIKRNGLKKAKTLDWKVITDQVISLYYDILEAEPVEKTLDEKPVVKEIRPEIIALHM